MSHPSSTKEFVKIYTVQKLNMELFLKCFFKADLSNFWKKYEKFKFSWLALLFKPFCIKIQPDMSEQEKKQQRIYDLLNAKSKPKKISQIIGVSLWPPLSPDHNPLDYAILGIFENKTNTTSHPNIGLLKTAIEEESNKICK